MASAHRGIPPFSLSSSFSLSTEYRKGINIVCLTSYDDTFFHICITASSIFLMCDICSLFVIESILFSFSLLSSLLFSLLMIGHSEEDSRIDKFPSHCPNRGFEFRLIIGSILPSYSFLHSNHPLSCILLLSFGPLSLSMHHFRFPKKTRKFQKHFV